MPEKSIFGRKWLSPQRVLRTLDRLSIDPYEFETAYNEVGKGAARTGEPTAIECKAVETFQRTGDFTALRVDLGGVNPNRAYTALKRVTVKQAVLRKIDAAQRARSDPSRMGG